MCDKRIIINKLENKLINYRILNLIFLNTFLKVVMLALMYQKLLILINRIKITNNIININQD